jgi:uncharacterized protein (TIGR03437 family)
LHDRFREALSALFGNPAALATDPKNNLYVVDAGLRKIRIITPQGNIYTVVAGAGSIPRGYTINGRPAPQVAVGLYDYGPAGIALDSIGNLYVVDVGPARVLKVSDGVVSTVAGTGSPAQFQSGDAGPATCAPAISQPLQLPPVNFLTDPDYESGFLYGIAVDPAGAVFFAAGDGLKQLIHTDQPTAGCAPIISRVFSASAFGAFSSVAPGSWIEIYGSNLAANSRSWRGTDFNGTNAPTSLDGSWVSVGNRRAFINYISPTQVNAQIPSDVGTGPQSVIVGTAAGSSSSYTVTVNAEQPGLLAPSSFNISGMQYVAALFSDGKTYVLPPGSISGLTSRRAQPGDVITLYGTGFGAVTPSISPGEVVQQSNTISAPFHLLFGQTEATVLYAGLAPYAVGLYQFNVIVPNVSSSDSIPLTFTLAGVSGRQTLLVAVH